MPSQVYKRGPTTPEMNITPLIDVVFLLIVFFMLVNTIVTHESVEMLVPDLDESQARKFPDEGRVIVNVVPQEFSRDERLASPLRHPGLARRVQIGAYQNFSMDELRGVTEELERRVENNPDIQVILRADAALHYGEVQPVLDAITAARIGRVNLVAYDPTQD